MKYPNLCWALGEDGLTNYQLADKICISEARLSRCLNGRIEFSSHERERITKALGYPEAWLFAPVKPPARPEREAPADGMSLVAHG
jgi:transcriptional regulator with XRE-family HTH domain